MGELRSARGGTKNVAKLISGREATTELGGRVLGLNIEEERVS